MESNLRAASLRPSAFRAAPFGLSGNAPCSSGGRYRTRTCGPVSRPRFSKPLHYQALPTFLGDGAPAGTRTPISGFGDRHPAIGRLTHWWVARESNPVAVGHRFTVCCSRQCCSQPVFGAQRPGFGSPRLPAVGAGGRCVWSGPGESNPAICSLEGCWTPPVLSARFDDGEPPGVDV